VLSYFDVIASAFDLNRRKPDPYVYTYTMGLMGVKPDQCVIVEDSALGIQAGKAAGAKVIALKDRDGAIDQREADVIIERIEQLLNYVEIDK
jgi:beta-phosphoglucomutase-like phosphatase (HAD superfamily)